MFHHNIRNFLILFACVIAAVGIVGGWIAERKQ